MNGYCEGCGLELTPGTYSPGYEWEWVGMPDGSGYWECPRCAMEQMPLAE